MSVFVHFLNLFDRTFGLKGKGKNQKYSKSHLSSRFEAVSEHRSRRGTTSERASECESGCKKPEKSRTRGCFGLMR